MGCRRNPADVRRRANALHVTWRDALLATRASSNNVPGTFWIQSGWCTHYEVRLRWCANDLHVVAAVSSQKIKVVQLVPVFHDVPLDLGRVNPRDEVFHVTIVHILALYVQVSWLDECEDAS